MDLRNFNWYNENTMRRFPFTEDSDLGIIQADMFIDAIVYSREKMVSITSIQYIEDGEIEIILSDDSTCYVNPLTYTPYSRANILYYGSSRGFFIFGENLARDYLYFLNTQKFDNLNLEQTLVINMPGSLYSIKVEEDILVGDIKFVGVDGVMITKVDNDLQFSAIYQKDECDLPRTNCLKSVNQILPDKYGNIDIEASGILGLTEGINSLTFHTILTQDVLCVVRFEDQCSTANMGPTGPIGPIGPIGDRLGIITKCCECEQCDTAEKCASCENCNTCENCNACEQLDGCTALDGCLLDTCLAGDTCLVGDICFVADLCLTCDVSCDEDNPYCEFPLLSSIASEFPVSMGVAVRDISLSWYYRENSLNRGNTEKHYIKYWDYENNEAYMLLTMRCSAECYTYEDTDEHILYIEGLEIETFSGAQPAVPGSETGPEDNSPIGIYMVKPKPRKTYIANNGLQWQDFTAYSADHYSHSPELGGWVPNSAYFPQPRNPTVGFFTPSPNSSDMFSYCCDQWNNPVVLYSTWIIPTDNTSPYKQLKLLWPNGDEALLKETYNDQIGFNVTLVNITKTIKSSTFKCFFGLCETVAARMAHDIAWPGPIDNYTKKIHFNNKHMEVIGLSAMSIEGETWIDNPEFSTKFTSVNPSTGFKDVQSATVQVYNPIALGDTESWDALCNYCDVSNFTPIGCLAPADSCEACDIACDACNMCNLCNICNECDQCDTVDSSGSCLSCDGCDTCDSTCDCCNEADCAEVCWLSDVGINYNCIVIDGCCVAEACPTCNECDANDFYTCATCENCNTCDGCDWCDGCDADDGCVTCNVCDCCDSCLWQDYCDICDWYDLTEVAQCIYDDGYCFYYDFDGCLAVDACGIAENPDGCWSTDGGRN